MSLPTYVGVGGQLVPVVAQFGEDCLSVRKVVLLLKKQVNYLRDPRGETTPYEDSPLKQEEASSECV